MHQERKTTIVLLPVCNIPCKNKIESLGTLSQILANLYSDISISSQLCRDKTR